VRLVVAMALLGTALIGCAVKPWPATVPPLPTDQQPAAGTSQERKAWADQWQSACRGAKQAPGVFPEVEKACAPYWAWEAQWQAKHRPVVER
jgi:hypothetical protein